jgi:hypothetical protein
MITCMTVREYHGTGLSVHGRGGHVVSRNRHGIKATGLLPHETGGWCHPFSHVGINVDHKKRVDLGVLRGADHDGLGEQTPF